MDVITHYDKLIDENDALYIIMARKYLPKVNL